MLLLCFINVQAQVTNRENYDLKQPKQRNEDCKRLYSVLDAKPKEARFGVRMYGDSVYLSFSDPQWLAQMIKSRGDGIAIDLVQKEQFQCDNISRFPPVWSHRGFLLRPLYRDELFKNAVVTQGGNVIVFMGKVPPGIKKENTEGNYILIDDKMMCIYQSIVNVEYHGWDLLESGLYYDSISKEKLADKYKELGKTLRFSIPFEKNKSVYKPEDLKPLRDSLRMTDYAITKISIKAFTSVEGSYEANQDLQNKRAQSIINGLQSFQNEKIESTVTSSENWVEFLNDVAPLYPTLVVKSKEEIKSDLRSENLLSKLEPILRNHRKGIIEITLTKRLSYREGNPDELKTYFQQSVEKKNIDEAMYLQQIIFNKIRKQELAETFIQELRAPESLEFGSLLINNASYGFDSGLSDVFESISSFERLDQLLPNNPRVRYNLCALKLQSWKESNTLIQPLELKKEIDGLAAKGIHPTLIKRLQINYYILMSEKHLQERQYSKKDATVKYIYDLYKTLKMKDEDILNLAKYFSHNSRFDWAESVTEPRIHALDVSEDLLFYYLSLTIFDGKKTKGLEYRESMLNAININPGRFCSMFNSISMGGISFQLLDDTYLRNAYCESCK